MEGLLLNVSTFPIISSNVYPLIQMIKALSCASVTYHRRNLWVGDIGDGRTAEGSIVGLAQGVAAVCQVVGHSPHHLLYKQGIMVNIVYIYNKNAK
jgi:hypothetical protein